MFKIFRWRNIVKTKRILCITFTHTRFRCNAKINLTMFRFDMKPKYFLVIIGVITFLFEFYSPKWNTNNQIFCCIWLTSIFLYDLMLHPALKTIHPLELKMQSETMLISFHVYLQLFPKRSQLYLFSFLFLKS